MNDAMDGRVHERWARLRFAIIGPLLAAPPRRGELRHELEKLKDKLWKHPATGEPVAFGFSTLERWLRTARRAPRDPLAALRRQVREDFGEHPSITPAQRDVLATQHRDHPGWSYQLHADNLGTLIEADPSLGAMPSYASVRRYMRAIGLTRKKERAVRHRPGEERAAHRLEKREVRSYETEYVHGLWHLDFHHGSRPVLLPSGKWQTPKCLCVLDDHSRLVCHAQWYLGETAQNLIHALSQAIQKRALPRALLTDNGAAMLAAETTEGLLRLGILHETTLPYSPYQNAKQEVFWAQLEGRLVAMLEGVPELSLELLNESTQAWVEREYHRALHRELGTSPMNRYLHAREVGRKSPSTDELRDAFTTEERRMQRQSDGTITVEGIRFEVPSRRRQMAQVTIRYAGWDLSHVLLCDERTGAVLERLYPLDKTKNADGHRRPMAPPPGAAPAARDAPSTKAPGVAPLLSKLLTDYRQDGVPPAYLTRKETDHE